VSIILETARLRFDIAPHFQQQEHGFSLLVLIDHVADEISEFLPLVAHGGRHVPLQPQFPFVENILRKVDHEIVLGAVVIADVSDRGSRPLRDGAKRKTEESILHKNVLRFLQYPGDRAVAFVGQALSL